MFLLPHLFSRVPTCWSKFLCLVVASLWVVRGFPHSGTTIHLHLVRNQCFYPMKGTPAAAFALTCWVKCCDTGSFLQATRHLQMSESRVTHAGESLCHVTPSQELPPSTQETFLYVWFIYVYVRWWK